MGDEIGCGSVKENTLGSSKVTSQLALSASGNSAVPTEHQTWWAH